MAASEPLAPVRLDAADVFAGVALSDGAQWNQTADDWQLFVTHGDVRGLRTGRSELVASAATLPFEGGMGWLSMVLVAPEWRHRGLATRLLDDGVQRLQAAGLTPVLDATPAGEAVYRRLGFARGFEFERWEGELPDVAAPAAPGIREAGANDLDAIAALDHEATGLDRRFLLRHFLARQGTRAWLDGEGFVLARQGRRALQIGPLVARGAQQALALLRAAFARLRGRVFLDLPARWCTVADWLAAQGFRPQRPFARMALAPVLPARVRDPGERLFVLAGPEFG